jgi:hypothetical protein
VARSEGLTIGGMSVSSVTNAILDNGGVQYDIDKLIYLGSPVSVFPNLKTSLIQTKNELLMMYRAFRLVGTPYILPRGTPKPQVQILQETMRKAYKDSNFHKDFKKLAGFDASPLIPEEQEKVIRELPRDGEMWNYSKSSPARIHYRPAN